jgi:error-prone DNA polymerase
LFPETRLRTQSLEEKVIQDYSSLGLSARGHPMVFLREKLLQSPRVRGRAANTTAKIKTLRHGSFVVLPGLSVILQRPPTAKGTAFATLEDESGVLDLIFHKDVYERYRDVIREEPFLWVKGVLQRDGDASQVVVKGLEPIFSDLEVPIAPGAHALRY